MNGWTDSPEPRANAALNGLMRIRLALYARERKEFRAERPAEFVAKTFSDMALDSSFEVSSVCHTFSEVSPKRLVENRRHEGVELGGCFGLEFLHGVHFGLKLVEVGNNSALAFDCRERKSQFTYRA